MDGLRGRKRLRVSELVPPLSPLVHRLFEQAFPPHSDGPTPTNRASARGADAHIGVIEFGDPQGWCATPPPVQNVGRGP